MKIEDKQRLSECGVNVDTALERFMNNEGIFVRFLGKFLNDVSMQGFLDAVEKKDFTEAFHQAHTLKGLAGNLSMDRLYDRISPVVEILRKEKLEEQEAEGVSAEAAELKEIYDQICNAIREME